MPSKKNRVMVRLDDDELASFRALRARLQAEKKVDVSDSDVLRLLIREACEGASPSAPPPPAKPSRKKGAS